MIAKAIFIEIPDNYFLLSKTCMPLITSFQGCEESKELSIAMIQTSRTTASSP